MPSTCACRKMTGIIRVFAVVVTIAASAVGDDELPAGYKIVNPYICKPREHFKIDCNYCTCAPEGGSVGACTRMLCPLDSGECVPETYFQIKDNLCSCPKNGRRLDSNCFAK